MSSIESFFGLLKQYSQWFLQMWQTLFTVNKYPFINILSFIAALSLPILIFSHVFFPSAFKLIQNPPSSTPQPTFKEKVKRFFRRLRIFSVSVLKKYGLSFLLTVLILNVLLSMHDIMSVANPSSSKSFLAQLYTLPYIILNPLLGIDDLLTTPFSTPPCLNLLVRVLFLIFYFIVFWFMGKLCRFIAQTISNLLHKSPHPPASPKNIFNSSLLKKIPTITIILSIPGTIFSYTFGSSETKDNISELISFLKDLLDEITLTSNIKFPTAGMDWSTFFNNAACIIFSILILTFYLELIITAYFLLKSFLNNRDKISGYFRTRPSSLSFTLICFSIIVIFIIMMFVFGINLNDLHTAFLTQLSGKNIWEICLHLVSLIIIFTILFAFIAATFLFIIYTINFISSKLNPAWNFLKKTEKNFNKKDPYVIFILISSGFILIILFSVFAPTLYSSLNKLFTKDPTTGTPLFSSLLALLIKLITNISLFTIAGVSIVAFLCSILSAILKFFTENNAKSGQNNFSFRFFKPLLPFLSSILDTLSHAFRGFRTEAQKNSGIFLAAGFASLASLLNTFFGLRDFYHSPSNLIPTICSLAIAFAVQMIMLIAGLKAGEVIAEHILLDFDASERNTVQTLIRKTLLCILSVFCLISLLIILVKIKLDKDTNLPSFCSLSGFICFTLIFLMILLIIASIIIHISALRKMTIRLYAQTDSSTPQTKGWIKKFWKILFPDDNASSSSTSSSNKPTWRRSPLHLTAGVYLIIYFSLMIVSTGFAFVNLFSYYADQAALHQKVYDQIHSEVRTSIPLHDKISKMTKRYNDNIVSISTILNERETNAVSYRASLHQYNRDVAVDKGKLFEKDQTNNFLLSQKISAESAVSRYQQQTNDFYAICQAINDYLHMDYDACGTDVSITVKEYQHFWFNLSSPSYVNHTFIIRHGDGANNRIYGPNFEPKPLKSLTIQLNGKNKTATLVDRYQDPDDGIDQSISISERTVEHCDLYDILNFLLSQFKNMERTIYSLQANQLDASQFQALNKLLQENAILDDIRYNVYALCSSDKTVVNTSTSMDALSGRVTDFLEVSNINTDGTYKISNHTLPNNDSLSSNTDSFSSSAASSNADSSSSAASSNADSSSSTASSNTDSSSSAAPSNTDSSSSAVSSNKSSPKSKHIYLPARLANYQKLDWYINYTLNINDLLKNADPIIASDVVRPPAANVVKFDKNIYVAGKLSSDSLSPSPLPSINPSTPQNSGDESDTTTKDILRYLNYAHGISNSNFLISYDTLLHGQFGLNPNNSKINGLYSSTPIALFILLICFLIDMAAFFSGLLIFKEVFLMNADDNEKLKNLGYISYETLLTQQLTYLKNLDSNTCQTIMDRLLHESYEDLSKKQDDQKQDDQSSIIKSLLTNLGISSEDNLSDLQNWLYSQSDYIHTDTETRKDKS